MQLLHQLTNNTVTSRAAFVQWMLDQLHDINKECGYPNSISANEYKQMYEREGIATRVVSIYPTESWAVEPEIYEDEDADVTTEFEAKWDDINKRFSMQEKFSRLDEISGIGHYGVFFLGVNDGKKPEEPVEGVEEKLKELFERDLSAKNIRRPSNPSKGDEDLSGMDSKPVDDKAAQPAAFGKLKKKPGEEEPTTNAAKTLQKVKGAMEPENTTQSGTYEQELGKKNTTDLGEEDKPADIKNRKLLFITPLDETQATISSLEKRPNHWRCGKPEFYNLTFFSPDDYTGAFAVPSENMTKVHWTRIVHVADNCKSNEIFGTPRMKKVYNRLLDIRKLLGGSAEMMWKGGFPGLVLEVPHEINDQVEIDRESLAKEVDLYMNSLKKYMALQGLEAKTLQGQISDPTNHLDVQILAICIALEVPKRVFMGTEEAKIASINDATAWLNRVSSRNEKHVTPRIIRPTVDMFIAIGELPDVEEYFVDWPDLHTMTDADKASVAAQLTQAMVQYCTGGADTLMAPLEFLTLIMMLPRETAIAVLKATEERLNELSGPQEEEQQMMLEHEQGMQETLVDGLAEGAKQSGVHIPEQMLPATGGGGGGFGGRGGGPIGQPKAGGVGMNKPRKSNLPVPSRNQTHELVNLEECSQCGQGHPNLQIAPLNNAVGDQTHWSICPTLGQPLMIAIR